MNFKLTISIILLISVIGCSSNSKAIENQSDETKPPAATSTSLTTNKNTKTPISSTNETISGDNWDAAKNCVTVLSTRPIDYDLKGTVAMRSLSSTILGLNLSLLNLENNISKEIPTPNPVDAAAISTDRTTLAYLWFNAATSKWELPLLDAAGNLYKVAWSSDQNFGFQGWLNDHQLIIVQDSNYLVVDPYQDSQLSLSPSNFPDFNLYHSDFYVTFDPLLAKAIYRDGKINVLDLNTNTIMASIQDGYDRTPIVAWQSSGEQVAVVATLSVDENTHVLPDEIFVIDKNEHVKQLTHLYNTFGLALTIESLSWSSDGEKIAFWLDDGQGNDTLMVANVDTGKVTNYCILNTTASLFPIYLPAPIWSPYGDQLLVENRYSKEKSDLLVVDLSRNIAFPIAENQNPVGWMIKP